MFKHILVAVDLSPQSAFVVKKAKQLGTVFKATLSVIHVIEHSPLAYGDEFSLPIDIDLEQTIAREARNSLTTLCKKFSVTPEHAHIANGSVKLAVHDLAKKIKTDLIIVGSHGHHGLEKLLGSRANAILHDAPCDTLAIKISEE